jgi:hypothetical protein
MVILTRAMGRKRKRAMGRAKRERAMERVKREH